MRNHSSNVTDSCFQFVPWFFAHIQPSWHISWIGAYTYHLWFLAFLMLFTLIALPLFVFLRGCAALAVRHEGVR